MLLCDPIHARTVIMFVVTTGTADFAHVPGQSDVLDTSFSRDDRD